MRQWSWGYLWFSPKDLGETNYRLFSTEQGGRGGQVGKSRKCSKDACSGALRRLEPSSNDSFETSGSNSNERAELAPAVMVMVELAAGATAKAAAISMAMVMNNLMQVASRLLSSTPP